MAVPVLLIRGPDVGQAVSVLPAQHAPPFTYTTRPPTSGNHLVTAMPYGMNTTPLIAEAAFHNMEHGAVVIWYQPGEAAREEAVGRLMRELGSRRSRISMSLLSLPGAGNQNTGPERARPSTSRV